jgi:hypothetical protein
MTDVSEIRDLAAKLAPALPAGSRERQWALLIASGKMHSTECRRHFRRICVWVRDSRTHRVNVQLRMAVLEWLSANSGRPPQGDIRGARRLEMRLNVEEAAAIQRAASQAGLSMADYARRATLVAAERV